MVAPMALGSRLCVLVCAMALAVGVFAPARAATPTTLRLSAPQAYAGSATTVSVALADQAGAPIAAAQVLLERRTGGTWRAVGTVVTDAAGRASKGLTVSSVPADNALRASYAGDPNHSSALTEGSLTIVRREGRVSLAGPRSVRDEHAITLRIRWRAANGQPVAGAVLRVYRKVPGSPWRPYRDLRTGKDGGATLRVVPRTDTAWLVQTPRLAWVEAARSVRLHVDNRPGGRPVRLPKGAPSPRIKLPAQARAVGRGAHVSISRLSDPVWRQMVGRTWHAGCPVGRDGLRIVQVNYWDYRGYRRRGELVASTDAAGPMAAALAEMFRRYLPIRAMYRVDRFGWSSRSHGGNDYASMAAGNTSAFNCRDVTGRPGIRSPHSWGRALDVNTWENPYRSAKGIVPNTWWQSHSHYRVAWRSRSHAVVQVMARHGLRWTYGNGDTQHFDYVGRGSNRLAAGGPAPCTQYCD
jgi:hypothetical protein